MSTYSPEKIRERIEALMNAENLNQAAFANKLDISRSNLNHVLSGRNRKPGIDLILKILEVFPNINPEWLLLGKGKMYKNESEKKENPNLFSNIENNQNNKNSEEKQNTKPIQKPTDNKTDNKKDKEPLHYEHKENNEEENNNKSISAPYQVIIFYPDKTFDLYRPR